MSAGNVTTRAQETEAASSARAFNLFAVPEDYFDSPYPYFRLLRDHDPIHANQDGSVLVTRYSDVRQVWRDPSGLVDKSAMFAEKFRPGPLLEHHTTTMLFRDPPDHDRLRSFVHTFFSTPSVAALRTFVDETVARLLGETAERREVEFVRDFAFRLPVAVICRIIGLPLADAERIQAMGRRILFPLNPKVTQQDIEAGHAATAEFKDYLRGHVNEARDRRDLDPAASLINALVAVERSGAEISENEILHMCILTLNGGHETTTNLISGSLNALLDHPEQLAQLREGAVADSTAVEELLRYVTPLQLQGRRTTKPVELSSGTLPLNTEVILCQAAANRDERNFKEPDTLNLRRAPNPHVAFGTGIHACLGQALARLEAGVAIPAVVRRFHHIERQGPAVFTRNVRFRGIASLPLSLH